MVLEFFIDGTAGAFDTNQLQSINVFSKIDICMIHSRILESLFFSYLQHFKSTKPHIIQNYKNLLLSEIPVVAHETVHKTAYKLYSQMYSSDLYVRVCVERRLLVTSQM